MDTGDQPMGLEEGMMATDLHFPTLQIVVIHRLSLALLGIIPITSGMVINRISSVALGKMVLGEHLEVVEGPQDPTEGCLK